MEKGYQHIIRNSIDKVYQTGITTKILQHMARIRNSSSLTQARRWVMELLQNSQDAAYPEQPVKVRIELFDDELVYSHNGKPFRVKDVLSIINQVSSKSDDEETVGKFGTGFVTTFQLSEMVKLESILKDKVVDAAGNETVLPCKPFSIVLDRRGTTDEEILRSIKETMQELERVDASSEEIVPDLEKYYTKFHYRLENEGSREAARIGMEDLNATIYYVLCFSKKLGQVELVYHTAERNETVTYRITSETRLGEFWKKEIEACRNHDSLNSEKHQVLSISRNGVTLASMLKEGQFEPVSEKTPRLYIDFPLLGAEKFPFPLVVNADFAPNEPRSGISLSDNVNSPDARKNKQLMEAAVDLYEVYLSEALALGLGHLEHIISIPEWQENPEMSETWVREHIYRLLFEKIKTKKIISGTEGMVCLAEPGLVLIKSESPEEREGMKQLIAGMKNTSCPVDDTDWVMYLKGYQLPAGKVATLSHYVKNAEQLMKELKEDSKEKKLEWNQLLYDYALKNEKLLQAVRAGEIAIFPNQLEKEEGKLFAIGDIYRDPGIPEKLKEVADCLDLLKSSTLYNEELNIRHVLIHEKFENRGLHEIRDYEADRLVNHIITRSDRGYKVKEYSWYSATYDKAWRTAWFLMLSCGPDKELSSLMESIFPEEVLEYEALPSDSAVRLEDGRLWQNSYKGLVLLAAEEIQKKSGKVAYSPGKLSSFSDNCFESDEERAIDWLNRYYEKAFACVTASKVREYAVFPVQSGEMKNSVQNSIDLTENDELKEIAAAFSDKNPEMDYLRFLFHRKLVLSTEQGFSSMKEGVIAGEIDRVVNQILSSMKLKDDTPEHQKAGTKLLAWIRKHIGDGLAQKYFPSFYNDDDQMRLLTPEAATAMANKAEAADWLMKELDCENIEEAKDKFVRMMKMSTKNGEGTQLVDDWEEEESEAVKSVNPLYFSSEDDVFFDQELRSSFDSEDAFSAFCKKVGLFGERFAFDWLRKDLLSRGYTEAAETASVESCGLRRFTKPGEEGTETAQLEYPDYQPGAWRQPGYDIRLVLTSSAGKREECYYEVKTHTTTSIVRNIIQMSDEQMRCALKHKDHYSILNVLYFRFDEENSQVEEFNDPEQQIAVGKMVNAWEGYRFRVR